MSKNNINNTTENEYTNLTSEQISKAQEDKNRSSKRARFLTLTFGTFAALSTATILFSKAVQLNIEENSQKPLSQSSQVGELSEKQIQEEIKKFLPLLNKDYNKLLLTLQSQRDDLDKQMLLTQSTYQVLLSDADFAAHTDSIIDTEELDAQIQAAYQKAVADHQKEINTIADFLTLLFAPTVNVSKSEAADIERIRKSVTNQSSYDVLIKYVYSPSPTTLQNSSHQEFRNLQSKLDLEVKKLQQAKVNVITSTSSMLQGLSSTEVNSKIDAARLQLRAHATYPDFVIDQQVDIQQKIDNDKDKVLNILQKYTSPKNNTQTLQQDIADGTLDTHTLLLLNAWLTAFTSSGSAQEKKAFIAAYANNYTSLATSDDAQLTLKIKLTQTSATTPQIKHKF